MFPPRHIANMEGLMNSLAVEMESSAPIVARKTRRFGVIHPAIF